MENLPIAMIISFCQLPPSLEIVERVRSPPNKVLFPRCTYPTGFRSTDPRSVFSPPGSFESTTAVGPQILARLWLWHTYKAGLIKVRRSAIRLRTKPIMGTSSIAMFMSLCLCLSTNGDSGESGFAKKKLQKEADGLRPRLGCVRFGMIMFKHHLALASADVAHQPGELLNLSQPNPVPRPPTSPIQGCQQQ